MGQTVEVGAELVAVANMSTVWVVADAFERDAARIDVGAAMRVSGQALGQEWQTRVAYIDPQVAPETRTVRIRGEVANRDGRLRFGMYVDVDVMVAPREPAITVAKAAVQTIGDRQVVCTSPMVTCPGRSSNGRCVSERLPATWCKSLTV